MSDLRHYSEEYLALRRALGYKLVGEGQLLARFVTLNRPGFPGGSKPWKGWSHGEQGNLEAVSA